MTILETTAIAVEDMTIDEMTAYARRQADYYSNLCSFALTEDEWNESLATSRKFEKFYERLAYAETEEQAHEIRLDLGL